ncbi:MAG: hypoxanthine-guanine phosphoribosyltransferase [Burkholderiales bacterium]|nr:hypoxanthine-guanine phosphoribosyltransferase [Burkholderiales bacterium]MDR4516439.1 hypoxanthine-guanine phosphoribosyltransferase [Nitrosomonas sp.]
MLTRKEAEQIRQTAELIYSAEAIEKTVQRLANEITAVLSEQNPLVLCVMKGGVVFAGHLLPKLIFPMNFDYVQVSRYHNETSGGEINWIVFPQDCYKDRTVLVIDDILDEGITLEAIRKKVLDCGAKSFYSVVLVEKELGQIKPYQADFVGLILPNRYVFGFGMDIHGAWRNLPAIYALNSESEL